MTHLADMEELLHGVTRDDSRDYMKEALSCYMAHAYRATIVLTFIALFDDILEKLGELSKVNAKAREVYNGATKRRGDQEVFESYLIDQLKSKELLSNLDTTFLELLRTLRNKSSHPSGHRPSAEEARFIYREAIDRFLAREILSTTQLADEVLLTLSDERFFPSKDIQNLSEIVQQSIANIHPATYAYLIAKVREKFSVSKGKVRTNCKFFLCGLAKIGDEQAKDPLLKTLLVPEIRAGDKANLATSAICSDGSLYKKLDAISIQRFKQIISERVDSPLNPEDSSFGHPASVLAEIAKTVDGTKIVEDLGDEIERFLAKFPYSATFNRVAIGKPALRELVVDSLMKNAGSNDFNTANRFCSNLQDIDTLLGKHLTEEEAFDLLNQVLLAAKTGAWTAIDARSGNFSAGKKIKAKAASWAASNPGLALSKINQVLSTTGSDSDQQLAYITG